MKRFSKRTALALACLTAALVFAPAVARAAVAVGEKPQFAFKALDGTAVSSESLKGKLVLLDFWATWCGPCVAEAPHMVKVHEKYGPKGLQVIGISLDRDPAALKNGIKQLNFTWPQHLDAGGKLSGQFGVSGIPKVFLIGPDGTVLWDGHPARMDDPIEKAFREHPPQLVDARTLAQAREVLKEAEQKIAAGDHRAAMKTLAKVPEAARVDADLKARVEEAQKTLEAEAAKMLAEVDPLIAKGEYVPAINRLKELGKVLAGTPAAADARKKLNELLAKPEAKAQVETADKVARSEEALVVALALQKQKKDELAYPKFKQIVKEYEGTEAAATASAQLKRYEGDPSFVKRVIEKEAGTRAKAALSMARSYKAARKTDQARKKYQSIIQEFPGTTYATEAQRELAALGK